MKIVQQLTCLTLGRPNGPAYSTGELLNTPLKLIGLFAAELRPKKISGHADLQTHSVTPLKKYPPAGNIRGG